MTYEAVIGLVLQYGYLSLFFALWLGIVGMPVPDEVVVMTGGLVTTLGLLAPVPAFILTYLGVVSGLTLGYVLGYLLGPPILDRLVKRRQGKEYLSRAYAMINRYGSGALVVSYFFPVIRHLVPYLTGISRFSYPRYALFSYSAGLIWTLFYFMMGRLFGQYIELIGKAAGIYGWYALAVTLAAGFAIWLLPSGKVKGSAGSSHTPGIYRH